MVQSSICVIEKHFRKKPFIVGGGLSDNNDLINLLSLNDPHLEGVICGKSYYLGKIDIKAAQQILS